jgi:hypothetical protein
MRAIPFRQLSCSLGLAVALAGCGPDTSTPAADPSAAPARQTFSAQFSEARTASPTGFSEEIHYRDPENADGKPYAVAEVRAALPEGSRIDTSAIPICPATDQELLLQGPAACPAGSRVGGGFLTLDSGALDIEATLVLLNNHDELILFVETTNTPPAPVRFVTRSRIEGITFVTTTPPLPSVPPPDPYLAVKDVMLSIEPAVGDDGRAYITTPDSCPSSGQWTVNASFTYRDGVTETVASAFGCQPG